MDSFFVQMILLRSLFVASLAGYLRFSSKRVFMAASSSPGDYSSAFVTCPNKDVAKKIARFACTCCIISQTGIIVKNGLGGVSVFDSYLSNWATVTKLTALDLSLCLMIANLTLLETKFLRRMGYPFRTYFGLPKPVRQFSGPDWAEDNFCQSE